VTGRFNSWVGIIFGDSMFNTDAHILEFYNTQMSINYKIYDGWSVQHSPPQPDTTFQGTDDIKNIEFKIVNGRPVVIYTRLLKTGDKYDKDLVMKNNDIAVAWGKGQMKFHEENYLISVFDIDPNPIIVPKNIIEYPYGMINFSHVEKNDQAEYRVTITGTLNTFVGLLFGNAMRNVDVNVVEFLPSSYTIFDGWSSQDGRPDADIDIGGTDDLKNIEFKIENDRPVITYTRLYKTADQYDKEVVQKNNEISIVWGYGTLKYHENNITITTIDVGTEEKPTNIVEYPNGRIEFETSGSNACKITIFSKFNTWVGLMFAHSMKNADAHLLEIYNEADTNKYKIYDAWSIGHSVPQSDLTYQGTDDIKNIEFKVINGVPAIVYTRLLVTGDKYDKDLALKNNDLAVAWGDGPIDYHDSNIILTNFDIDTITPPIPPHTNIVEYPFGVIKFTINDPDTVKISINGTDETWASLYFGNSLTDNDAHVITFKSVKDLTYEIYDGWSTTKLNKDEDLKGTNDIKNVVYENKDNKPTLTYTRKLKTGDKFDKDLVLKDNQIIITYGKGEVSSDFKQVSAYFDILNDDPKPDPPKPGSRIDYPFGFAIFEAYEDNAAKITIQGTFDTWVGLLFGESMTNSDAHVLEFLPESDSNHHNLYDSWSEKHAPPVPDTTLNGTDDIKNVEYKVVNGKPQVTYTRLMNTGDKFDKIFEKKNNNFFIGWGEGTLSYHGKSGYKPGVFNLDGSTPAPIPPTPTPGLDFWDFHGIGFTILWSGFNFVGFIAAKNYIYNPKWIYVHYFTSGITALFTLIVVPISIFLCEYSYFEVFNLDIEVTIHNLIGLVIFIIVGFQIILGLIPLIGVYWNKRVEKSMVLKIKVGHKVIFFNIGLSFHLNFLSIRIANKWILYALSWLYVTYF
jgi:hypothetical protein